MGIIDKTDASFDTLIRDKKAESAFAMIMATFHSKGDNKKQDIAVRLRHGFELFREKGAGTYEGIDSQFESQYTLGLEMGIWADTSSFTLSELAYKVATFDITMKYYMDIFMLNLFTYKTVNGEVKYVHFLKVILENLDEKNKINKEKIKEILFENEQKNDNRNALFNFLKDTSYFEVENNELIFSSRWEKDKVLQFCNLEYEDKDIIQTQKFMEVRENYSKYVTKIPNGGIDYLENAKKTLDNITTVNERAGVIDNIKGSNIIYYGAPGTGKSYTVSQKIREVYSSFGVDQEIENFVFRSTLHPEYSYTDFVGQIMPTSRENEITYEFQPGIFTMALKTAINNPREHIFLVLEELSRANVAAVFGDLFQLLDRKDGESEYKITQPLIAKEVYGDPNIKIYIPKNLSIISTVNTCDQNVFVMDTAFKRRFEWKYVSTKPIGDINNPMIQIVTLNYGSKEIEWFKFYQALNDFITSQMNLNEDKQIGQFFVKFDNDDQESCNEQIQNKLLQYLWEDIHIHGEMMSNQKLFESNISSFYTLYDKYQNNQPIFSAEFLEFIGINS